MTRQAFGVTAAEALAQNLTDIKVILCSIPDTKVFSLPLICHQMHQEQVRGVRLILLLLVYVRNVALYHHLLEIVALNYLFTAHGGKKDGGKLMVGGF